MSGDQTIGTKFFFLYMKNEKNSKHLISSKLSKNQFTIVNLCADYDIMKRIMIKSPEYISNFFSNVSSVGQHLKRNDISQKLFILIVYLMLLTFAKFLVN